MLNSWGSLRLNPVNNELTLQYVQEALLTPATKLYKTVGFFEKEGAIQSDDLNAFWDVLISDTQISQADGKAAAQYFYSGFLGCGYPASSARTTKLFYDATKEFLNDLDISEEKRVLGQNAPSDCPADPVRLILTVSSGRPSASYFLDISAPVIVPTTRSVLTMGKLISTAVPLAIAGCACSRISRKSRDFSSM